MTNESGLVTAHGTKADAQEHHELPIFVNTHKVFTDQRTLDYAQIVQIAFPAGQPGIVYTVVWREGDRSGHLVAGGPGVSVKAGMMFDVTPTTES